MSSPGAMPVVRRCPVTGDMASSVEVSKCPITLLRNWIKDKIIRAFGSFPLIKKLRTREVLVQASEWFTDILLANKEALLQLTRGHVKTFLKGSKHHTRIQDFFISLQSWEEVVFGTYLSESFREFYRENKWLFSEIPTLQLSKILSAYTVGINVVYNVWKKLIMAHIAKFGVPPSPEEAQKYKNFIVRFCAMVAESPSLHAITLRSILLKSLHTPFLIDDSNTVQINMSSEEAIYTESDQVLGGDHPDRPLRIHNIENRFCPALTLIPKFTLLCCEIIEDAYSRVYNHDNVWQS